MSYLRSSAREAPLITAAVARHAASVGDRTAYCFLSGGATAAVTFEELNVQAQAVAAALAARCEPGDRVGLVFVPGLDPVIALFGCFFAGMTAVPMVPARGSAAAERFMAISADCEPRLILSNTDTRAAIDDDVLGRTAAAGIDWVLLDEEPPQAPEPNRFRDLAQAQTPAIIQYTSGSTGTPKGVVITHRNLVAVQKAIMAGFRSRPDDRMLSWLPFEHDMGLIGGVLHVFWEGGTTFLMSPASFLRKPSAWLAAISNHAITISGAPDFAYDRCCQVARSPALQNLDLSSWRIAYNGAEPVRHATLEHFAESFGPHGFDRRAFYPCYGLAEATLLVSGGERGSEPRTLAVDGEALEQNKISPSEGARARRLVSCGLPRTSGGVAIVEPDGFRRCGEREIGEIWIAGDSVAEGYWQRAAETAETFEARTSDAAGPYMRSGDIGFLDGGELFVTGRLKDIIILRGRNLYAADIEATAGTAHPLARAGRSVALATDEGNVLVQEVKQGAVHDTAETLARDTWRAVLTQHGLPLDEIVLARSGTLLWTTSGKVRRRATWARIEEEPESVVLRWRTASAFSEEERARAEAMAVLRACAPNIEPQDLDAFVRSWMVAALPIAPEEFDEEASWSDMGLDSLAAVEFVSDLESATGVAFSDSLLFDHPKARDLLPELEQKICR